MSYPKKKNNAYDDSIQLYNIHNIQFYQNIYKNEKKKRYDWQQQNTTKAPYYIDKENDIFSIINIWKADVILW